MTIGDICNRDVVVAERETTGQAAAKLMRHHHVGSLIVIDRQGSKHLPVGVVTDRDLLIEIYALDLDASVIAIGDIMNEKLTTVPATSGTLETVQVMRMKGVRRVPVVDAEGNLLGIVTLDDMIQRLAKALTEVSDAITQEQTHEIWLRPKAAGGMVRPQSLTN